MRQSKVYLAEFAAQKQGSKALTEKNISILSLNTRISRQGLATMQVSFEVESKEELNRVIDKIRGIESVVDIERATG